MSESVFIEGYEIDFFDEVTVRLDKIIELLEYRKIDRTLELQYLVAALTEQCELTLWSLKTGGAINTSRLEKLIERGKAVENDNAHP